MLLYMYLSVALHHCFEAWYQDLEFSVQKQSPVSDM